MRASNVLTVFGFLFLLAAVILGIFAAVLVANHGNLFVSVFPAVGAAALWFSGVHLLDKAISASVDERNKVLRNIEEDCSEDYD